MTPDEAEKTLSDALQNPQFLGALIGALVLEMPGHKIDVDISTIEGRLAGRGLRVHFQKNHIVSLSLVPLARHAMFKGGDA